ncbi:hypothetical protein [Streptomyces sp. NRRL S-813]|uniref:hypothetical protein n=1 Tax=Streptomyces sp. NRRL S-813 TaxID=1463919 RepID=UPI0004BECBB4|nr:hypothetical protein [Streptomyces sp. NRRL S-813]
MITELAVERVEFACGHCWHKWSVDYDVQYDRDEQGDEWEYFIRDGQAVPSPYDPRGAPPCPLCGRHWVGRLVARRPVPLAPETAGAPRYKIGPLAEHRPERHTAPPLEAHAHERPRENLGRSV